MPTGIFLIQDDGQLVEMNEQTYSTEDVLQDLLAKYPNLLVGDQIASTSPRRWLLVKREMGVPCEQGGSDRWSLDHLFLDQDGIPTLVEVKRSIDTRIRREVVGQMLDYVANAVAYWPVEQIRAEFEKNCEIGGLDAQQTIVTFLGPEADEEAFWQKTKTNLQAGKIRMLFVADIIPPELRRIVEFLNQQMDPAEVLAIEVRQYVGQGMRTLVPRLIGQTAEAEKKKSAGSPSPKRQWDEPSFFEQLQSTQGDQVTEAVRRILAWTMQTLGEPNWGKGQSGSFTPVVKLNDVRCSLFSVYTFGSIYVSFGNLIKCPPFDNEAMRKELARRLQEIPHLILKNIVNFGVIKLDMLVPEEGLRRFLDAMNWAVEEMRRLQ